jgi:hypothetical protein
MKSKLANTIVNISGELISPFETEMAYHFFDGSRIVWIPKSQCEWDQDDKVMQMPLWLAMEKELI